jgi:hypothetical protein
VYYLVFYVFEEGGFRLYAAGMGLFYHGGGSLCCRDGLILHGGGSSASFICFLKSRELCASPVSSASSNLVNSVRDCSLRFLIMASDASNENLNSVLGSKKFRDRD